LSRDQVKERLHLPTNGKADVAAIDILELVNSQFKKFAVAPTDNASPRGSPIEPYYAASEENFPVNGSLSAKIAAYSASVIPALKIF
jgi:hypothetical protein